jgi:hypothetical protein
VRYSPGIMTEPLMIGTRGWNPDSGSDFYPAELPDDWRFCYYSNNLRSVLVPQETWDAVQRADVAQWLRCDPNSISRSNCGRTRRRSHRRDRAW